MRAWERAVADFIAPYRDQRDVVGALVCGSYVTGRPSPRSDLDVVIVLAPGSRYRERGNRIVRGYLVEYFANSPGQYRAYFANERAAHRTGTATMFATGRTLFEKRGSVRRLRAAARALLARPLPTLKPSEVAHEKYFFWDSLDNLRDLHERKSPGFAHAYHHQVQEVYAAYARYLGHAVQPAHKLHAYLSDGKVRAKYLLEPFPDRHFAALLRTALSARGERAMLHAADALVAHATERLGGFTLDGFRLRTRPGH